MNLYLFEKAVAQPGCTLADAIENIDIGGPTLLRAAAKNYEAVTVVVDPADYPKIITEMQAHQGATTLATRFQLARKVFAATSADGHRHYQVSERQAGMRRALRQGPLFT